MSPHTVQQKQNAKLLLALFARVSLDINEKWGYARLESETYMPLSMDRLYENADGSTRFSMAHNGIQNGDVMADPDMEFSFYPGEVPALVAHSYQNDYAGVYRSTNGNPELATGLDMFMGSWLRNLKEQDHKLAKQK